jgi:hypothetical protein
MLDLDLDVIGHNPLHIRDVAIAVRCVKEHRLDMQHRWWRDVFCDDFEILDLILLRAKRHWDSTLACFEVVKFRKAFHFIRV